MKRKAPTHPVHSATATTQRASTIHLQRRAEDKEQEKRKAERNSRTQEREETGREEQPKEQKWKILEKSCT